MMELSDFEESFLNLLREAGVSDYSIERNSNGDLIFSKLSPCEEIGSLDVHVSANEVTISCKISHSHINADIPTQSGNIFERAAVEIRDIISDKIAVTIQRSPDGQVISTGWCPKNLMGQIDPAFTELMNKMFGGPTHTTYWFWSGKSVVL